MCFALIGPLDVLGEGEGGGDELPYVDHGRRTDEGRDKNKWCKVSSRNSHILAVYGPRN